MITRRSEEGTKRFRAIEVEAWPYCGRCLALHQIYLAGFAVRLLGIVGYVLGILRLTSGPLDGIAIAELVLGCLIGLAGVLVGDPFSWRKLASAHLSKDQFSLHVQAHQRFAADVQARVAAERATTIV